MRAMNFLTMQDIIRYAMAILMTTCVLAIATEGATTSLDYPIVREYNIAPKPRSKPREIRGFKPHSMSTAIGFGKRQSNSYESSKMNGKERMTLSVTDYTERFPIAWFVQFLKMNPDVARKVVKNLLIGQENAGSSVTRRYKKNKSDFSFHYDE